MPRLAMTLMTMMMILPLGMTSPMRTGRCIITLLITHRYTWNMTCDSYCAVHLPSPPMLYLSEG